MPIKEEIFEKLKSSEMEMREIGTDLVLDMIEFNSIKNEEAYEYALSLLRTLDFKNSERVEGSMLSTLSLLISYFTIQGVNWQPLLPILKRVNDYRVAPILWILANSLDMQYLPVIQKYKDHREESIRSAAIEAEEFLLANASKKLA